ncbi:TonB-dependent siderophore receptor [Acinetobacter puyangensis]|uniref:TonB-dependent siderophore receptor n=1 Tax=Acinetobacter puyangensis TaxID=1096779 RepID=UPI003A4E4C64
MWGALALAMGLPAYAETDATTTSSVAVKSYAIPAGPLANTLREISRVSGQAIRFETADVQDVKAPEINGSLATIEAVQRAISDSGLTMSTLANGAIQVHVHMLGAITVTATRSEAEQGYKASRSETATRGGADLKDVPQAITVITAKAIEDTQAQSVQDILQNVAGVIIRASAQGTPSYSIRGFTQTSTLSNGIDDPYASITNVAGIDKVEVLKGPQAILSGANTLGGAVNIVAKKPTAERIRDVTLSYGTHEDKTGSLDIGDAITQDKKLSYRVIGSMSRQDHSTAGFDGREANYALGELRWKDDATDLTVGAVYDDSYDPQNYYTFALTGDIQKTPSMRLGNKHDGVNIKSERYFYDLEHSFEPWVTAVSRLQYSKTEQDLNLWGSLFPVSTANMIMHMANSNNIANYKTLSGDHYLRFDFDTGLVGHKLSTGINHAQIKIDTLSYSGAEQVPVYQDTQYSFPDIRNDNYLSTDFNTESKQQAWFLQDLISFGDWHASIGARRTSYASGPASTYYYTTQRTTTTTKKETDKTTFNAGLVYNVTPNTSVYASYSEGFLPQSPTATFCSGGTEFPPMETENKEVGIKGESPTGGLSWGVAAYQMDQSNVLQYNAAGACYDTRKAKRISGVELETSGRILPGWNVLFNYTFAEAKDVEVSTTYYAAEPKHQLNIFTTYDFQSERLKGYGLSLGVNAFSESRLGTTSVATMVPGGARVDIGASYQHNKDWSLRLGVKNVFDRTLYGYSSSPLYVPIYEGRTATLTWKYSF